ncbi:MAG: hypothetical protein N2489_06060 [Clostridia bacterium]|nr:hypothetical protein [Clostridia bacterium]
MNFYVSIIFLGIMLIIIALIWIAYDMKRSQDYVKKLDDKKQELLEIISDCEQMIEELNKFSDYIVTQMDIKNQEMCSSLKIIEEKLEQISLKNVENNDVVPIVKEKVVNGTPGTGFFNHNSDLIIDNIEYDSSNAVKTSSSKSSGRSKDKVIPINNKFKEVIRLSENGMSDTEIARALNMGKGEIQLILGMNK